MTTITTLDVGVFFDGMFGQLYNDQRVFDLARYHGMKVAPDDAVLVRNVVDSGSSEDWDSYTWLIDKAVEYLNDHVAPDGTYFEWFEGDFRLSREVED